MKYFFKGFTLGLIVFSGVAFATEEDIIDVPEKPISGIEAIDISFVEEGSPIKDEYYDNLEDNIFYNTEIKTKDDASEETIYTLDMIKRTVTDEEGLEIKPDIISDNEFVEIKPDIIYDEEGGAIKPEPPFIDDAESYLPSPIMTIGGGELSENDWVYMTANMSPTANHQTMSGSHNISVSEPFAIMALLSACVAFVSLKRKKEV